MDNKLKLQFGCGLNYLKGWDNFDAEIDITKRLPWENDTVSFCFAEHVTEHVAIREAYNFFLEVRRILKPGGVFRIAVPSVVKIQKLENDNYRQFLKNHGWASGEIGSGVFAITMHHGHQIWFCEDILQAVLTAVGFSVKICQSGESDHDELRGIDSHHRAIGKEFNEIESIVAEGTKI